MDNIKHFLDQFSEIASTRNELALIIESYLIQPKMAIITGNIEELFDYLEKASIISIEKDLPDLHDKIDSETNRLNQEIEKYKRFNIASMNLPERIKFSQLEEYIKDVRQYLRPQVRSKFVDEKKIGNNQIYF